MFLAVLAELILFWPVIFCLGLITIDY